jgi:hypothetical protein
MKLDEIAFQIYHRPTKSFHYVEKIDFVNNVVDTDELRDVPLSECDLGRVAFMVIDEDE